MKRVIVTEGPDDVAALLELAIQFFGATPRKRTAAGPQREATTPSGDVVELREAGNKDKIPTLVATLLLGVEPDVDDADRTELVGVVYDPDAVANDRLETKVADAIGEIAATGGWTFDRVTHVASRARGPRPHDVRVAVAKWRSDEPPLNDLPDEQNLERVLDAIGRRAMPPAAHEVEEWLRTIARIRGEARPTWKSCLHAWCSILTPKHGPDRVGAVRRICGQEAAFRPHVAAVLDAAGLRTDLAALLG